MFTYLKKFFYPEQKTTEESYLDVVISLNKNLEIDLSVFLKDDTSNIPMDFVDYSISCAKFIDAINSDRVRNQIISVLDAQIKTKKNTKLIDSIIIILDHLDKEKSEISVENKQQLFIKPSQVFSRYSV